VSDFDRRWMRLVAAARAGEPATAPAKLAAPGAESLADVGLAFAEQRRRAAREGRGLALAALTFLACLCGAAALADALGWTPSVQSAARELADVPRRVPRPSFVPSTSNSPALRALAPGRALEALELWWGAEEGSLEGPR
jgi:hypothetical protein